MAGRTLCCLAVLLAACQRPLEKVAELSTDAPSRTGLRASTLGVLIGNEAGRLDLIGWSGELRWSVALEREIAARPAATSTVAIAASVAGEWIGVVLTDGRVLWRTRGGARVTSPLASDGQRVFAIEGDGTVRAVDAATGQPIWMRSRLHPGTSDVEHRRYPAPLVLGAHLVLALGEAGLFALDRVSGETHWRAPLIHAESMALLDDGLVTVNRRGDVRALAEDGSVRWSHALDAAPTGEISIAKGRVWIPLEPSTLVTLRSRTGEEVGRVPLPATAIAQVAELREAILVPTAGPEGWLLGLSLPSLAVAFRARVDSPLRAAPWVHEDRAFLSSADGRVLVFRVNR